MNSINRPIAKRLAYTNLIGNVDDGIFDSLGIILNDGI